jgi:hypothetical protein
MAKKKHTPLDNGFSAALEFCLLRAQTFVRCGIEAASRAKAICFGAECQCGLAERLQLDPDILPLFTFEGFSIMDVLIVV